MEIFPDPAGKEYFEILYESFVHIQGSLWNIFIHSYYFSKGLSEITAMILYGSRNLICNRTGRRYTVYVVVPRQAQSNLQLQRNVFRIVKNPVILKLLTVK